MLLKRPRGFFVAQAVGKKFSAVLGFASEEAAKKATPLIKKAANRRKLRHTGRRSTVNTRALSFIPLRTATASDPRNNGCGLRRNLLTQLDSNGITVVI